MGQEQLRFGRRFLAPDALLALVELGAIAPPLVVFLELDELQRRVLSSALLPVVGVAWVVWTLAVRAWLTPLRRASRRRLAGEVVPDSMIAAARGVILALPIRALLLRVGLWTGGGLSVAALLRVRAGLSVEEGLTVVSVTAAHAFGVNVFRALWYASLLEPVRATLTPELDPIGWFAATYRRRLVLAALATGTLGIFGIVAFTYFFIPINLEQYLRVETYYPLTLAAITSAWYLYVRRFPRPIDDYLSAAPSTRPPGQPSRDDQRALAAYRAAQAIPYKLALAKAASWILGEALLVVQSVLFFSVDLENAALTGGAAMVVTLGAALYEALWHRATMRPLLTHLAARHRPAPETVRTPLSLRSKMLAGFGALTFFSCGLSLFLSFMQFKTLATDFIQRESELRLDAILGELRERAKAGGGLDRDTIEATLRANVAIKMPPGSIRDQPVLYYLPPGDAARALAVGGGSKGPPALPWTGEALMRRLERGQMELSALHLTGAYARLRVGERDLGAFAVLLSGYRGRGPSTVPQIKVLVFFFVVLLIASMGIVILVATDLARPIRELQRRADAMARGDLVQPVVTSSGEGDEVGRLTFAIEDMRRALNDKLRSSTEINLSLEQEVSRRTGELERRNRELKEALDRLERAQGELVRSEKMASMGRLVAGIAHEINNPVNAVVNTAGPLGNTVEELAEKGLAGEALGEVRDMVRVIQRGANRTKDIVRALHNYSRGDEDRVVEVDLEHGLDESLDLLRHQLRQGITVERRYGQVGKVRGHAGQLNQVFMNLLANAAQAIGDRAQGGRIVLSTARKDGQVVIRVTDDGPGIPAEALPRIFDPFFTTKDVGKGAGLGLSIVHGIVERHRGQIAVDSAVGRGTTFTVSLPA